MGSRSAFIVPMTAGNRARRDPNEGREAPRGENRWRDTREGTMDAAKLLTKRHWIVELAMRKPGTQLFSLHHIIDFEWMREAYWLTRKDGATGIDGMTAQEYEANLEANLKDLRERIISGRYKAPPVRRAYIPKADGSQRPLGIPTFEDKVAQREIAIVLRRQYWVLDVDIRKYFDSIPHQELRAILDQRVTDGVIRRMIGKWLKAGALEDGLLHLATEGTPQGGVISPILSNIFLHHVLDGWFENEVRPRLSGDATLVRFADDFVMTFETRHDAKRVLEVLGKRLGRYGLTLHPDKTRFIDFRPQRRGGTHADCKDPPFDFLGFTHTWGRSRNGKNVVRQTTAKSRFARALLAVKDWCRTNRHRPILDQLARLSAKLVGHFAYYGITGNSRRLQQFRHEVTKTWRKWLARRTRSRRLLWDRFNAFLARHPLPPARIVHRYATRNEALP